MKPTGGQERSRTVGNAASVVPHLALGTDLWAGASRCEQIIVPPADPDQPFIHAPQFTPGFPTQRIMLTLGGASVGGRSCQLTPERITADTSVCSTHMYKRRGPATVAALTLTIASLSGATSKARSMPD